MTTIAYKAGILACDSAWTNYSGTVATHLNKITRLSSGAVIGEAGDNDSRAVRLLIDKIKSFDKLPPAKDFADTKVDYVALIVFPNGEVAEIGIEHCEDIKEWRAQVFKVNRGLAAVGSGGDIAVGYMGAGGSAAQAVNFACGWDPNSKLPVHSMSVRLHPKKASAKRPKPRSAGRASRPR